MAAGGRDAREASRRLRIETVPVSGAGGPAGIRYPCLTTLNDNAGSAVIPECDGGSRSGAQREERHVRRQAISIERVVCGGLEP